MLWPLVGSAVEVPILVGAERHAHGSPAALRVRQPTSGVVVLVVTVVVCEPPAGVGVVLVVLCDVVVDGGAPGAAGVVTVVLCDVVVDEAGGDVGCAKPRGAAIKQAAAVTMSMRFMEFPPVPTPVAA